MLPSYENVIKNSIKVGEFIKTTAIEPYPEGISIYGIKGDTKG